MAQFDANSETRAFESMMRMAKTLENRPFFHGLVAQDLEKWPQLDPIARRKTFERTRRRYQAAMSTPTPTLAL